MLDLQCSSENRQEKKCQLNSGHDMRPNKGYINMPEFKLDEILSNEEDYFVPCE